MKRQATKLESILLRAIRRRIVGPSPNEVAKAKTPGVAKTQIGRPRGGSSRIRPNLEQEFAPRSNGLGRDDGAVTLHGVEGDDLHRQISEANGAYKTMKYFRSFGFLIPHIGADECEVEVPRISSKPHKSFRRNGRR